MKQSILKGTVLSPQSKLIQELRASHAGETGAVWIYKGILRVRGNEPTIRAFAEHHLNTEQAHLELISGLLPETHRSRLLPFWRLAGFLTGAIPALFSANAVYGTIESVETFVAAHYLDQLSLPEVQADTLISETFKTCRQDEIEHRDEASQLRCDSSGPLLWFWQKIVSSGSKVAVQLARQI